MRMFEAWRIHRKLAREVDDRSARLAFQAGARHAMTELAPHLDGDGDGLMVAYRLNDEIRDFGRVALLP